LVLIALLALAAVGLRTWLLVHTEVAARDSIGYIRLACKFQHRSWVETLRTAQQHPGYPLALLALSFPVRQLSHAAEPQVMQLSAQLTSAVAGFLLVIPMYYLGRALFSRQVGFWSALLFQCLPASGRVLSDGLSEGLFLLLATSGLLAAVLALRRQAPAWFALTGLFGGLAYLIRPEGGLIIMATGVVLLAMQAWRSWRASCWRRLLACAACLGATTLLTCGPLVAVTGAITVKNTPHILLKQMFAGSSFSIPTTTPLARVGAAVPREASHVLTMGRVGMAFPLAAWWSDRDSRQMEIVKTLQIEREWWATKVLGIQLVRGTGYLAWFPMFLGLWWFRNLFRREPGTWVMLLLSLGLAVLLWRVAFSLGYLSERHMLLIILCGTYWATAALFKIAGYVLTALGWCSNRLRGGSHWWTGDPARASAVLGTVLLLGWIVAMLPKTLEPLHDNREGFRHAGMWLAEHSAPWDEIIDPYSWSHYYAGKVFFEERPIPVPPGITPGRYVVLELGNNEHVRLSQLREAVDLSKQGQAVARWTARRGKEKVDVVVYAVPRTQ
jgi:hypothetical protein